MTIFQRCCRPESCGYFSSLAIVLWAESLLQAGHHFTHQAIFTSSEPVPLAWARTLWTLIFSSSYSTLYLVEKYTLSSLPHELVHYAGASGLQASACSPLDTSSFSVLLDHWFVSSFFNTRGPFIGESPSNLRWTGSSSFLFDDLSMALRFLLDIL